MTRKARSTNTSAEDGLKGAAPEQAEAQHGAVELHVPTEVAATDAATANRAALAPLAASPAPGAAGDGGPDADAPERVIWIVTCSREGGKRRAGRRWAFGQTRADDLTDSDILALEADPSFEVQRLSAPLPGEEG